MVVEIPISKTHVVSAEVLPTFIVPLKPETRATERSVARFVQMLFEH